MTGFVYSAPPTLQAALQALDQAGGPSLPLAGGTNLLNDLRQGTRRAGTLIDLRQLTELRQVGSGSSVVSIGARTTFAQLERDRIVRRYVPLLAEAASFVGNPLIRMSATLGGNIASARAIQADAVVPLVALGAQLVLQNAIPTAQSWHRTVDIADYLDQEPDARELITWISVPMQPCGSRSFYWKMGNRKASVPAIVSLAACLRCENQQITDARLVLGGLARFPFRASRVEELLRGEKLLLGVKALQACLALLRDDLSVSPGALVSLAYRMEMACVLVQRALEQSEDIPYKA